MKSYLIERVERAPDSKRLLDQERTILEVTELICEIMNRENISRAELAVRLRKSRGFVSQLLDGGANMTLRTISDIFHALKHRLKCNAVPEGTVANVGGETIHLLLGKVCSQAADTNWTEQYRVFEFAAQSLAG